MTTATDLDAAALDHAADVVYRHLDPTPQYAWPLLAAEVGAQVWVKHENATPTGAFKVRGGLVYLDRLARERPSVGGTISATRGNHGQSLAYAGRALGIPVTIVVPRCNSAEKNAAMVGFGAELVVHGDDFQEAREHSVALAEQRGLEGVPPFHPDLVAGVATYARELFDAAGPLDAVFVPVGMGSGANALIAVRDRLGLATEIIGVVSENAPAYALSVAAGKVVDTDSAHTFVDGVAVRSPHPDAVRGLVGGVARMVRVSDDDVAGAMRMMFRTTHQLPCPSGAAALAGLWQERERWQGRNVAVVMTSSNVDTEVAAEVLAGRTPAP
ncbi:MAG: threonine dehydratase [Dermatophilaceae bacterium]